MGASAAACVPTWPGLQREPCGPGLPQAAGRQLVFLANVDPVDAVRALHSLDPETTLVVIVRWGRGSGSGSEACASQDVILTHVAGPPWGRHRANRKRQVAK